MFNQEDSWSYTPSDIDLDDYMSGLEGFSNLSEENLTTLMRSFNEMLQQKKSHLSLIYNLKECENKEELVGDLEQGVHSL